MAETASSPEQFITMLEQVVAQDCQRATVLKQIQIFILFIHLHKGRGVPAEKKRLLPFLRDAGYINLLKLEMDTEGGLFVLETVVDMLPRIKVCSSGYTYD